MPLEWIKALSRPIARPGLSFLAWCEDKLLPDRQLDYSPVFIVGVPRSGTTLLSQVVNCALETSYFTNLATRFRVQGICRPPVALSAWLARSLRLADRNHETFTSSYGRTRGLGNPNDSVMIWQHWFPNRYMGAGELSLDAQRAVYQAVARTERILERPFVDKCTHSSIRIRALVEIFPTAIFVRCVRNPLAVAQSIYVGWSNSPDRWDAARPKEYPELKDKSLVERVCGQVYYLDLNISDDLATVPSERVLSVNYKDLCLNPQSIVDEIADFMNRNCASTKQICPLPTGFPFSHTRRVDSATYLTLIDHLERLYGYEMIRLDEPA